MRLDTSQQMRTDMKLRMAPRMIQSMEILQLPLMALQERIDQELIENPILVDLRETTTPESETETDSGPEAEAAPTATETEESPTPEVDGMDDDWDYGEGHRPSRAALSEEADRKHDAMQNMASRPESLPDDLAHQLGFLDCDARTRAWPNTSSTTSTRTASSSPRSTTSSATTRATSPSTTPSGPSPWSSGSTRPGSRRAA